MDKLDKEIIITKEDTLRMLDDIFEKREKEWWDKFYSNKERPITFFKNIPDENLVSYCSNNVFNGGKALDIGCENGRNSLYLASEGFEVVGIDISEESINWAKELSSRQLVKPIFVNESLFDYDSSEKSFDLINDSGCFHHIKPHRREDYLKKINSYLKDDGYFSITCFNLKGGANVSDYQVYKDYSMHGGIGFSEFKIKKILETYFEIIEFREMINSDNSKIFGIDILWAILMKKRN